MILLIYAQNKMKKKIVIPFIILFFFSSFQSPQDILFQNNKVIIYMKNDGLRTKFLFENFEKGELMDVKYVVYKDSKKFIGKESITPNKELIKSYEKKYKKIIIEQNKDANDIDSNEDNIKIVNEIKHGKLYFYYYTSHISGSQSVRNSENNERKVDRSWQFVGIKKFILDVFINEELVSSKAFDLEQK